MLEIVLDRPLQNIVRIEDVQITSIFSFSDYIFKVSIFLY